MPSLEFTEYVLPGPRYGAQLAMPRGQANATQQVAIGATSTVSAAFQASTQMIEITGVAADCRIEIGASTVAATNAVTFSRRLRAGRDYRFQVDGGQYLAVIAIEAGADAASPVTAVSSDASEYTEDAVAVADPTGLMIMAVRRDTLNAAEVSADGDNIALKANSRGAAYVDATFGIADGGTDALGPVKVGGRYNATKPTYADGKRGDLQLGTRGAAAIQWMLPDSASPVTSAAAGADAVSNTFNAYFGASMGMVFNGTSWDRMYGNTAGQYVQGNVASGATDSGNPSKIGGTFNTTQPTVTNGQRVDFQSTNRGEQLVTLSWGAVPGVALADNADAVAVSALVNGMKAAARGYVFNGTTWDRARGDTNGAYVVAVPAYKAGIASVHGASAATTNAQLLGSGTKMVMGLDLSNTHATNWAYFKLFNKATTPTVGTDSPTRTIAIPPNSSRYLVNPFGRAFSLGIGIAITGAFTDLDTTAVLANQVYWEVEYV